MDPSDMPDMMGATASAAGVKGAVPAPASANRLDYLRGDGTWQTISVVADALAHKLTLNISIA